MYDGPLRSVDGALEAGVAEEVAIHLDGGGDVAGLEVRDLALDPLVEPGQGMEWHSRIGTVLSVVLPARCGSRASGDHEHQAGCSLRGEACRAAS